ncbi:MAG: DUF1993 domain-containing protein [Pseudomonadota bacterium]
MSVSLSELTVATYRQVLPAMLGVLEKGAAFAADSGMNADELVEARLHPEMSPLHFQIVSVVHHSLAAVRGVLSGEFHPPSGYPELDYAGFTPFLEQALSEINALSAAEIDGRAGGQVLFKLSAQTVPFTTENFLLCFSLPNLFFHATTGYDILRAQGVPLGKMDFLGPMRIGLPDGG